MFKGLFQPTFQRLQRAFSVPSKKRGFSRARRPLALNQKGNALVMASIFVVVGVTLVTVGARLISNASREAKADQTNIAEADNAARAGLEDALNYFIRVNAAGSAGMRAFNQAYFPGQTPQFATGVSYIDQPFNPQWNSNPKQSDTIDEAATIGLVNEYGLDNGDFTKASLIARYEVKRQQPGTVIDPLAAHDISGDRAVSELNGDGVVWSVTSTGYVYKRLDHTYTGTYEAGLCPQWDVPYDVAPNVVLAKVSISTEFRQVACNLPTTLTTAAEGAVYCQSVTQVHFANSSVRLQGAVTLGTNFAVLGMTDQ